MPVWPPPLPPDDSTPSDASCVVVVVDAEADTVMEEEKQDGKATYPCREVESGW